MGVRLGLEVDVGNELGEREVIGQDGFCLSLIVRFQKERKEKEGRKEK